jgi:5-methylthioadenosine/S-adenosylhomocysteine deaminase
MLRIFSVGQVSGPEPDFQIRHVAGRGRPAQAWTPAPRGGSHALHVIAVLLLIAPAFGQNADWIWTARYVVTMDGQRRVIENGAVAMQGDHIAAVGPRAEVERRFTARHRLDRPNALIAPGLVDTHTHAPMSLFRGIADDMRLQEWLEKYIFPAEAKNVNAEFVRWGARLACLEMALAGTTTFTDMYYFEDTLAEAVKEAGLRGVLGQTIIGFPAPDYKTPAAALAGTEKYIQRFRNDPLITPAVAPHSVYTTSDDVLKSSRALADKYHVPLLIHLSETRRENDETRAKHGKSPTQLLESLGVLNGPVLGAHGVWLDDTDLGILKKHSAGLAHCPSSNTKLASGVARVVKILSLGIPMGLGTDGFAGSNDDADLMKEMPLAAKLQKVTLMDPEALPARQALEMATIVGARALGRDKQIGSIEPSKRADLITIRLDGPNAAPMYNIYSLMVYSLKAADVNDVMVNGVPVVRDRRMLTLDAGAVLAKAAQYQKQIAASLAR